MTGSVVIGLPSSQSRPLTDLGDGAKQAYRIREDVRRRIKGPRAVSGFLVHLLALALSHPGGKHPC